MAAAGEVVKEFLFTTRDGLPVYSDSPRALSLCQSLSLVASTLGRNYSERVRFVRGGNLVFLFEQFPGLLGMVAASESYSVAFLRKQLAAVRDVVQLVLGRGAEDPAASLVSQARLQRAVQATVFMHEHMQSYMLNALEQVQAEPRLRASLVPVLREAALLVPGAIHALLFTDLKLAANVKLDDTTSLRASDLAPILAYFQGQFYPRGDRAAAASRRRSSSRSGSMRRKRKEGWHESMRGRPTIAAWLESSNDDLPVPKGVEAYTAATGDVRNDALQDATGRHVSFITEKPVVMRAKHAGKVQRHRLSSAFLRVETARARVPAPAPASGSGDADDSAHNDDGDDNDELDDDPLLDPDLDAAHLKSDVAPMFLRIGLRGGDESPVWVYYAELGSGSTLMIVARREPAPAETGVRRLRRSSSEARRGAALAEFAAARTLVTGRLASSLVQLVNLEQTHFTVLEYHAQFPHLLHFALVNRTANQMIAPTVIPLTSPGHRAPQSRSVFDFVRVSLSSAPEHVFSEEYTLEAMQRHMVGAASLGAAALANGFHTAYRRTTSAQMMYSLWFEDAKGRVVRIEQRSRTMPMLSLDANYYVPFAASLFPDRPDLICYELYAVFSKQPGMADVVSSCAKLLGTLIRR